MGVEAERGRGFLFGDGGAFPIITFLAGWPVEVEAEEGGEGGEERVGAREGEEDTAGEEGRRALSPASLGEGGVVGAGVEERVGERLAGGTLG